MQDKLHNRTKAIKVLNNENTYLYKNIFENKNDAHIKIYNMQQNFNEI